MTRCRELADVAAEQAQALGHHRSDQDEEIKALQSHVSELESRSDDDIIIGTLQRKLMSTKSAYKAFVRKFESMRGGLRKKSAASHVLEVRLDAKDEALMKAHDTHHVQVSALKKALWEVSNRDISNINGGGGSDFEKMGGGGRPENNMNHLINMSRLTKILETKTTELEVAQRAKMDAEAVTSCVKLELSSLKSLVVDLERATTTASNTSKPEIANFARRIISLSDELKMSKLEAFESKRAVQMVSEEKRNLELKIHSLEDIVHEMEEAKAALETQQLLGIPQSNIENAISIEMVAGDGGDGNGTTPYPSVLLSPPKGKEIIQLEDDNEVATKYDDIIVGIGQDDDDLRRQQQPVSGQNILDGVAVDGSVSGSERLSNAHKKIVALTKALASSKRSLQGALNRAYAAEHTVAFTEKERNTLEMQLRSVGKKENDVEGHQDDDDDGDDFDDHQFAKIRSHRLRSSNNSYDETKKTNQLKEAAAVTIKTLKGLLNEKNKELDILRNKLYMNRTEISIDEETAERSAMGQLNNKIYEESRDSIVQLREAAKQLSDLPVITQGDGVAINARLVNQLDDVSALLANKQEVIQQLEVKLRNTTNRLTRSEARCSEMIKERHRMASEFQVMSHRLEEESSRFTTTTTTTGGKEENRVRELQLTVSGKETQLKKLRTALIDLKKEFVQAQESAAEAAAGLEKDDTKKQQCHNSQLEKLTRQNEVLAREAENAMKKLKKAKEHEEKNIKTLEALQHERNALQHENSGLIEKLTKIQASLTTSQTELNELKEKLRGGGTPKKSSSLRQFQWSSTNEEEDSEIGQNSQLVELRARVQVLSSQNASLHKAIDREGGEDFSNIFAEAQAAAVRAEKHRSWELENILRQRGDTLEKRLDEKIKEVMELEAKLFQKRGRVGVGERVSTATKEKKVVTVSKFSSSSSVKGKVLPDKNAIPETRIKKQGDMFVALEKARSRIFELEEET